MMVMVLVGILSVLGIDSVSDTLDELRFEQTIQEMVEIRKGMIGDINQRNGNARSDFGYLGDVGFVPTNAIGIAGLTSIPGGITAWSIDATANYGIGWNGPYVELSNATGAADYLTDAWGNAYTYASAARTLTSLGADGAAGGTGYDADITLSFTANDIGTTVHGFILDSANAFESFTGTAEVRLYTADTTGALSTRTFSVLPAFFGYFFFANVPLGKRSISIFVPDFATNPTPVLGPIVFTVDKPQYVIDTYYTNVNP